jgi:hypothetical protein
MFVVEGSPGHVAGRIVWLRLFDPREIARDLACDLIGVRVRRHTRLLIGLGTLSRRRKLRVAIWAAVGRQTANRRVAVQALFPVQGVGAVAPGRLAVRVRGSERLRVVAPPGLVGGATLADH